MSKQDTTECSKDGKPCYVGAGTNDAHWRCGTSQCGKSQTTIDYAEPFRLDLANGWPADIVIEYARRHVAFLRAMPSEPERDKALADGSAFLEEHDGR